MECPYKKPNYLSETDARNCYATNRGWVVLKPNGKYDIVESIGNLDSKIKAWHEANGQSEFVQDDVQEEVKQAHTNLLKSKELAASLADVKSELKEIEQEIDKQEKAAEKKEEKEKKDDKIPADAFKKPAVKKEKSKKDGE